MTKGISIHVGVTEVDESAYGPFRTLRGCDNDAKKMAQLADVQKFRGLDPANLAVDVAPRALLEKDAKKDTILALIREAAKRLQPGDMFLMTYSGHGFQVKDQRPKNEEDDGQDEVLCPEDHPLLDDELATEWRKFKPNVRILVVTDSCHNGTVADVADTDAGDGTHGTATPAFAGAAVETGGGGTAVAMREQKRTTKPVRTLTPEQVKGAVDRNRELFTKKREPKADLTALVISMAACGDNESTRDDLPNGAFTTALLAAWNDGTFAGTHRELLDGTRAALPNQHPQFGIQGPKGKARDDFDAQQAFRI